MTACTFVGGVLDGMVIEFKEPPRRFEVPVVGSDPPVKAVYALDGGTFRWQGNEQRGALR